MAQPQGGRRIAINGGRNWPLFACPALQEAVRSLNSLTLRVSRSTSAQYANDQPVADASKVVFDNCRRCGRLTMRFRSA